MQPMLKKVTGTKTQYLLLDLNRNIKKILLLTCYSMPLLIFRGQSETLILLQNSCNRSTILMSNHKQRRTHYCVGIVIPHLSNTKYPTWM